KSYDLEFWTDSLSRNSKDLKFKGLRNDDDWILDGIYNEPLRLRSYFALKLWHSIHKPHYQLNEPKAKSTIDLVFAEVFKNSQYRGVYTFSESVDAKLLKLKENNDKQINGELFKASSYEGAPAFKKAPEYNNVFPHWAGFEMEYPIEDYRSHWDDLARLVNLVVNGSDEEFELKIGKVVNIENAIDYYLFVNLLRATDNLGKNYYIAKYDSQQPYFFIPWDLDGVMGIIQDGKRIATTDDILSNGLFDRLLKINPDGYKEQLKSRWNALRKEDFSNSSLFGSIDKIYNKFDSKNIYNRERQVWPNQLPKEAHYEYLKNWLTNRLIYLDTHFEKL
ncbi:MAG: CotH kinase family protein, partial [Eudoraea sp.]|nr:CotH kinase family protein [Eudoraea sp.]